MRRYGFALAKNRIARSSRRGAPTRRSVALSAERSPLYSRGSTLENIGTRGATTHGGTPLANRTIAMKTLWIRDIYLKILDSLAAVPIVARDSCWLVAQGNRDIFPAALGRPEIETSRRIISDRDAARCSLMSSGSSVWRESERRGEGRQRARRVYSGNFGKDSPIFRAHLRCNFPAKLRRFRCKFRANLFIGPRLLSVSYDGKEGEREN